MRHWTAAIVWALLGVSGAQAQREDGSTLQAMPRNGAEITLDGVIDEAIWESVPRATGMVERRPDPGAAAPLDSSIQILFDRESLWVATCNEIGEGEVPRAAERTRDSANIFSDDTAILKFDVRHDQRNTVGFGVNPAGAQIDFIAIDRGRTFRREYDAVWEAAVHVGDDEWCVEWRIPTAALGLAPTEGPRVLGFNYTRDHNLRQATYDWQPMPVELGPASAHYYGELQGLRDMASGRPLTLIPYALAGLGSENEAQWPARSPWELRIGGDAQMRLGEDVWGEMTLWTDFAQVDLDDAVLNLGRFPLFLPERRPFFLSGLDIFGFGTPGANQLFFSRRIGLNDDGDAVPMYGGLKVYGRTGNLSLGLLHVYTGDPHTAWGVARARVNVGEGSYVGAMATLAAPLEGERPAYSAGADFLVEAAAGRLTLAGFAASTLNDELEGETEAEGRAYQSGIATALNARWRGTRWRPYASFRWTDERFDPRVGFLRRGDVATAESGVRYLHRVNTLGLEYLAMSASGSLALRGDFERRLGYSTGVSWEADWRNGWRMELGLSLAEDEVEESFELVPNVEVLPGIYQPRQVEARVSRNRQNNPSLSAGYSYTDGFYGGFAHRADGEITFNLGALWRWSNRVSWAAFELPGDRWRKTFAYGGRLTIAPNTSLFMDAGTQLDSANERVDVLGRLRWRYRSGSDLFVVYRMRHRYGELDEIDPPAEWEHRITLKWTFRTDLML